MIAQDLEFIYRSLIPRTKIQLRIFADMLGCELASNLRKAEMAIGLTDFIINNSDAWLRCLPKRELDLMEIMVKMEKGSKFRTFPQPYSTVMEAFGFLIEERTDDSSTFTIVPALYDSIKEHLPLALSFRAANSYYDKNLKTLIRYRSVWFIRHCEM